MESINRLPVVALAKTGVDGNNCTDTVGAVQSKMYSIVPIGTKYL